MSDNFNILLIAPEYPYPPDDGHKLRNYNLFRNFRSGYTFDLLTTESASAASSKGCQLSQLGNCFRNVTFVKSDRLKEANIKSYYEKIKNIVSPHELSLGETYYSDEMLEVVGQEISSRKYDLIYFCGFSMYLYNK